MWSSEKKLVLSALKKWLNLNSVVSIPEKIDWDLVSDIAEENGVISFLHEALKSSPEKIPNTFLKRWLKIRENILTVNLLYISELKKIASLYPFGDLTIIQGGALLNSCYTDISLRSLSDIDLLVDEDHFVELSEILQQSGFTRSIHYPHRFEKEMLVLDIHFDIIKDDRIVTRRFIFDKEVVFSTNIKREQSSIHSNLYVLSTEDMLIFNSYHTIKHSFSRWLWLLDIIQILKLNPSHQFYKDCTLKAKVLGCEQVLLYTTKCINGIFGDQNSYFPPATNLRGVAKRVTDWVVSDKKIDQSGEILFFLMIKGKFNKILFILEIIFLRPEILRQAENNLDRNILFLYILRIKTVGCFLADFLKRAAKRET